MNSHEHASHAARHPNWFRWCVAAALGILAFYLFSEHRAHLFGALPYLLILACPLMHIFMHGSSHSGHDDKQANPTEGAKP